ncbi:hypothetical protein JCGZ_23752 [Jatropha curcas]|uniref:Uncharacterized protein n=1 Tax=Jatropha curcas TaxID=180498 RepID=A0A067LE84_JATCU|nr:uncharacterized protein LOC105629393 [Jatropha curcas]KDP42810.1 hypothetical protein JCGZ_23752 [Jatropha curcas]
MAISGRKSTCVKRIVTRKKVAAVFTDRSSMEDDIDFDKQFLVKESNFDDDNESMWLSSVVSSPCSLFEEEYKFFTSSFYSSMVDDIDFDKQLLVKERSFDDDNDCTWLSSVVSSPCSLFKEDYIFSTSALEFSVDDKKVASVISENSSMEGDIDFDERLLVKGKSFDDDSECMWLSSAISSPYSLFEEDEILVKERNFDDDSEWTWLSSAISSPSPLFEEDDFSTSSLHLSDDDQLLIPWLSELNNSIELNPEEEASYLALWRETLDAESISKENLKEEDSPSSSSSMISDLDGLSFSVSLIDLEGEDSEWISDTELALQNFESGFNNPSTPPSNVKYEHTQYCDSPEAADFSDFDIKELLFWPSESKIDWKLEQTWKSFSMSPFWSPPKLRTLPETSYYKSLGSKYQVKEMDAKKGCRRKLEFSSSSMTSKLCNNNCTKKMESNLKSKCMAREFLQDDITTNRELPIEMLLGLEEFDGHEGVDSEFNEDVFSLDDSL